MGRLPRAGFALTGTLAALLASFLGARAAWAGCVASTCAQNNVTTACYTSKWGCVNSCLSVRAPIRHRLGADPALSSGGCTIYVCDIISETYAPPGTACETDNLACTTDVCGGSGMYGDGVCHHNATGGTECGGVCLASGCCASPNSCTGGQVCPSNGGACACPGGYKLCGASCIPTTQCCTDGDCPSDPANHRHGVCGGGTCSYACDAGYKPCNGVCIPSGNCCGNPDCVTPPNGCYKTQGTCTSGSCTYTYNDGATCNADNDACTPNDKCQSGTCVADTANQVKCVQRLCHTAPVCNKTTGNCDDAAVTDGTACGGNGCAAAGTCTAGTCSSPIKDCSALNSDCRSGLCDPALTPPDNCAAINVTNGTACSVGDKCQLMTACSGGVCVGTPKSCMPSAECRVAMCNPSTGGCEESVAAAGTACTPDNACLQNAQCDVNGNCVGDTAPDGTPCDKAGCSATAACVTGSCACIGGADLGADPAPAPADLGTGGGDEGHGCAMAARGAPDALLLAGLFALVAWSRRRRRA